MSKIKCLDCNTILESLTVHDFVKCNCENSTFIDGGFDYMRLGGLDLSKILYWDEKENKFLKLKLVMKQEDEQLNLFEGDI